MRWIEDTGDTMGGDPRTRTPPQSIKGGGEIEDIGDTMGGGPRSRTPPQSNKGGGGGLRILGTRWGVA